MPTPPLAIGNDVPLAPLTTLGLGGPARHLIVARDETTVMDAVAWASVRDLDLLVLGAGSNVVVADAGFPGLVLRMDLRGLRFDAPGRDGRVLVHAAAGEPWDAFVDAVVARGLAGVECLAGIPGLVGATPIQNVGAYGQEVSETIVGVRAFDRATGAIVDLANVACAFGYRDSAFKRRPAAQVVLRVTFALTPGGAATLRYRELQAYFEAHAIDVNVVGDAGVGAPVGETAGHAPTIADVSRAVRDLRGRKSMLIDPADPNVHSVGSFFTNPVVVPTVADQIVARAVANGVAQTASDVPRFPASGGQVKLSAAWLIERSGFAKGYRRGAVGLSSNHALALVHHGGGTTDELLLLARDIRDAVRAAWNVTLVPEPTLVGTSLEVADLT